MKSLINILKSAFGKNLNSYYAVKGRMISSFANLNNSEEKEILNFIFIAKNEGTLLLKPQEAFFIYRTVKRLEKVVGDVAEVGVYKGGSAKIIRKSTQKTLHLFDTFEGLPSTSLKDNQQKFKKGELAASLESVKDYLKEYKNIYFYKGLFPNTANSIKNMKFSFVHLDVDLYESTFSCLEFFYPRITKGGMIISHDYAHLQGVKKAFDEFFVDKPEIILEPAGTSQAFIIKV